MPDTKAVMIFAIQNSLDLAGTYIGSKSANNIFNKQRLKIPREGVKTIEGKPNTFLT